MPPPLLNLGNRIHTRSLATARLCLGRGYKRIQLPPGAYHVGEIWRNDKYWHNEEMSDGYTYRLEALDRGNPYFGARISIWQNDLAETMSD